MSRQTLILFMVAIAALAASACGNGEGPGFGKSHDLCAEALDADATNEEGDVFCQLVDVIRKSDTPRWMKDEMVECVRYFDHQERRQLVDDFTEASKTALVAQFKDILWSGVCIPEGSVDVLPGQHDDPSPPGNTVTD
jgi:hypothetical protein